MKPTIKDIARIAGVSHTTVSRALNDSPLISLVQKERIRAIASELNYMPNMLAKGLNQGRSFTVGVIVNYLTNPFSAEIFRGVENVAGERGYVLIFGDSREDAARELRYMQTFIDRGVDGLIVYPVSDHRCKGNVEFLCAQKVPFVLVNHYPAEASCNRVVVDEHKGAYLIASHLLALGHRRIGFIAGPGSPPGAGRRGGFEAAMAAWGLSEYVVTEVAVGDYSMQAYQSAKNLVRQNVTAIFAFTDELVPGILEALSELNLSVPDDISLAGYGKIDSIVGRDGWLTTIDYPKISAGEEAMRLLIRNIDQEAEEETHLVLEPHLVVGLSTKHR